MSAATLRASCSLFLRQGIFSLPATGSTRFASFAACAAASWPRRRSSATASSARVVAAGAGSPPTGLLWPLPARW
jgi:hypothetical protein